MIKINKIKIEINTNDGLYGSFFEFDSGLNIIRGNNTSGKSSLFQAIIYCLGFEELLGGKNEKTMQSVLKDQVEYPDENFHAVLQSFIILEIENQKEEVVTIRRSVTSSSGRKPQLVDVFFGSFLDNPEKNIESRPMYIHDPGGASDTNFGFHSFLEEYLDVKLPDVLSNYGDTKKLYIQQVASSYILEQKTGWSDFFATMPYFSLQNKEARTVEFLLDMDVYKNKKNKQKLLIEKKLIENEWKEFYKNFNSFAYKGNGTLKGITEKPEIINNYDIIKIFINKDEQYYNISQYTNLLIDELSNLKEKDIASVDDNVEINESKLDFLSEELNQETLKVDILLSDLSFDKERLVNYNKQLSSLKDDLRKNKGAMKIKKLGAEFNLKTSEDLCPTCLQEIGDSLLPSTVEEIPMRIDENIAFIESQIKMINVYISGLRDSIENKEKVVLNSRLKQTDIRKQIRLIREELISNGKSPSVIEIKKILEIEKEIEFYMDYMEDFTSMIDDLKNISNRWKEIISKLDKFPKDFLSINDKNKIICLESNFKKLLEKFNYTSKSLDFISISRDNYLPIARKPFDDSLYYIIRFDSSASDFIRSIWAYTCSLYKTSIEFNANHPRFLMLDEPKQQDMAINDFASLLKELSSYEEGQVMLFASFENSDETFKNATKDIKFHLNYIDDKLIKPFETE